MLLTDREIRDYISRGLLVKDMVDPAVQVQQCGVDLTVAKVFALHGEGVLDFTNEKRKLPEYAEIPAEGDFWNLAPGTYHIAFNEKIVLPKNIAGLLLPRSSALVCGIVQHSALWDPGYEGRSFFHVEVSKPVKIYKNARIGQMIFFRLGSDATAYSGAYKGEDLLRFAKRGTNV
ncbi:MAG: deoxyuridine 5'-triphosphate nucleotidohydrolase [Candidatus Aenigmarchaeota archaeon]|nr:deoxyuridine 5'-triphosphate nucleotidohydrolase [Candidatus Aenigmarchaeota archaeon]